MAGVTIATLHDRRDDLSSVHTAFPVAIVTVRLRACSYPETKRSAITSIGHPVVPFIVVESRFADSGNGRFGGHDSFDVITNVNSVRQVETCPVHLAAPIGVGTLPKGIGTGEPAV